MAMLHEELSTERDFDLPRHSCTSAGERVCPSLGASRLCTKQIAPLDDYPAPCLLGGSNGAVEVFFEGFGMKGVDGDEELGLRVGDHTLQLVQVSVAAGVKLLDGDAEFLCGVQEESFLDW